MYVAVMDWDGNGRVTKFADFGTEPEAGAHVLGNSGGYPNAFTAAHPGVGPRDWKVVNDALTVEVVPEPKPILAPLAFMDLFTQAEKTAIIQASRSDDVVELVRDEIRTAGFIDLGDARTAQGLDILVSKGLLTSQRRDEVLAA